MKRIVFAIAAVTALLGCGDLYANNADSTSVDNKNVPEKTTETTLKEDKSESGWNIDISLYVSILSLLTAGACVALLLRNKGNVTGEMNRMATDIEGLRDDVNNLRDKRVRSLETLHRDLREELFNLGKTVDETRMMAERRPEVNVHKEAVTSQPPVYSPKIYYSVYQCGYDCFDECDFKDAPSGVLPFKISRVSPVEAYVEVMSGYDRALNSQVKSVCDEVSGSWSDFHYLEMLEKGRLYKDSEGSSYWKVRSKIKVRLS